MAKTAFSRIKEYIKNNWLFLTIMLVGITMLCVQMSQVILDADDYSLGIYSSRSIGEIIQYQINHYFEWGGGYTPIMVILLFAAGPFVWKTVLATLLILLILLTIKMVCRENKEMKWAVAAILWLCVFSLSIDVSSDVFYWLDGSMAYLFSTFQVFLLLYFFYTRMVQGTEKKYDKIILPIIAFFAGWSSAQSGCIAALLPIGFIIWQKCISKKDKKISKLYYISSMLSILGFLVFYFAPGNSARMSTFSEYVGLNIIERILYRSNDVINLIIYNHGDDLTIAPIFLYMVAGVLSVLIFKKTNGQKNAFSVLNIICAVYNLFMIIACILSRVEIGDASGLTRRMFTFVNLFEYYQAGTLSIIHFLPYVAAIIFFISVSINAFYISKENKNPLLFFTIFFGLLFQGIMVMAPYSPLRTTFYTTAFLWVALAELIVLLKNESIDMAPIFILLFTLWNFYFGIISLIIYSVLIFISKKEFLNISCVGIVFVILMMSIYAIPNYAKTFRIYYCNKKVDTENISRILQYNPQTDGDVLYLQEPCSTSNGFIGFVGIEWVERAVIDYYNLPQDLDLRYEGE